MIEHICLNSGSSKSVTEQDIDSILLKSTIGTLRKERLPLADGYYLSAGYIKIDRNEYIYGLYTPHTNLFERWIGFSFTFESKPVLSGAIIYNPEHYFQARERLYGGLLHGMPHQIPIIKEYPYPEVYPCLLTIKFNESNLEQAPFSDDTFLFSPIFAFAVVRLFQEF